MEKGRILLAVTGFHPQRWRELLSAEREVVLEPDGASRSVDHLCRGVEAAAEPACRRCPICAPSSRSAPASTTSSPTPACPTCRSCKVVADNLTQYMTEYVVWRVLDHHRQGALYRSQQAEEDLARAAAAAGQRHLRRHHGARQSRPRGGNGAAVARLSRSMAGSRTEQADDRGLDLFTARQD